MIKKQAMWILTAALVLMSGCSGCSTQKKQEPAAAVSTEKETDVQTETQETAEKETEDLQDRGTGQIISISMAEMEEKLDAKETFLVSFVTIECPYCQDFHSMLVDYVQTHPVTMYQVILDYEDTPESENREKIVTYFSEFNTVPGVFYVVEGENYSYLDTYHLGVGMEVFDEWVQENDIENNE